jgi:hypothetical protein
MQEELRVGHVGYIYWLKKVHMRKFHTTETFSNRAFALQLVVRLCLLPLPLNTATANGDVPNCAILYNTFPNKNIEIPYT